MKSLKDSLREEFYEILNDEKIKEKINKNSLDDLLINKAFEKLIEKSNEKVEIIDDDINDERSQFQNLIVNHLKVNNNEN